MKITDKLRKTLSKFDICFGEDIVVEDTDYITCVISKSDNKQKAQYNLYCNQGYLKDVIFHNVHLKIKNNKPNFNKLAGKLEPPKPGRKKIIRDG